MGKQMQDVANEWRIDIQRVVLVTSIKKLTVTRELTAMYARAKK